MVEPPLGVAVSVMEELLAKLVESVHVPDATPPVLVQLKVPGDDETEPLPVPEKARLRAGFASVNVIPAVSPDVAPVAVR